MSVQTPATQMQQDDSDLEEPRQAAGPGVRRYSATTFLILLVLMIAMFAFVDQMRAGRLVEGILLTLVLIAGVRAVGGRSWTLGVAALLAMPAIVGKWLDQYAPGLIPAGSFLLPGIASMIFVALQLLRYVLTARRVNHEVLSAGISVHLLMGIVWSFAYILVARLVPDAFSFNAGPPRPLTGFESAYFSFITLTTCGYGDIVPVAPAARMLAMMEAMAGTLYMATLIARLVSLYSSDFSRDQREP